MAKDIVTLYIDDSSIRLLVTQGTEIMKWAEIPLEPGQVKNAVVINEVEVAAKITQLLEVQDVKSKKVNVGVSGLWNKFISRGRVVHHQKDNNRSF
jgi:Tfp pilus assembly PilM family ATPase